MALELARKVSEIPRLYEESEKSTASLLKDFGFPEWRHALSAEEVESVLAKRPDLAELWLERGQDQRYAGGWGIEQEDGRWRIQSFADGKRLTIENRYRAVAEFIVRYVGRIGEVITRTE